MLTKKAFRCDCKVRHLVDFASVLECKLAVKKKNYFFTIANAHVYTKNTVRSKYRRKRSIVLGGYPQLCNSLVT